MPPGHAHIHVMGVPVRPVRVGGGGPGNPPQAQAPAQEGISRAAREQQGTMQWCVCVWLVHCCVVTVWFAFSDQAQREAEAEHRKAELRAKLAVSHHPEVCDWY